MKHSLIFICFISFLFLFSFSPIIGNKNALCSNEKSPFKLQNTKKTANKTNPMIAIVIDDLGGEDRTGVEAIFSIECPLTFAIMPALQNSTNDAERAHKLGQEVILHMPMEASANLPLDWYGPIFISNHDSPEVAKSKIKESLKTVPYAVGMNIHIGTGVSSNKDLMKAVLEAAKEEQLFFLDSRTTENSKCKQAATECHCSIFERDVFLEVAGNLSYARVIERMHEAIEIAKTQGYAIVIGHVGPVGRNITAKGIADSLEFVKNAGVDLVFLSDITKSLMDVDKKIA